MCSYLLTYVWVAVCIAAVYAQSDACIIIVDLYIQCTYDDEVHFACFGLFSQLYMLCFGLLVQEKCSLIPICVSNFIFFLDTAPTPDMRVFHCGRLFSGDFVNF